MKLLYDENLSRKLVDNLSDQYPGSEHVVRVGLNRRDDGSIWAFAKAHQYTIVTQDSDFAERSVLEGAPPKVIWIRIGNSRTSEIEDLLRANSPAIQKFIEDPVDTCLMLKRQPDAPFVIITPLSEIS
jgi:predicted nuclease of predicted toxin-antitoxin system